MQLKMKVLNWYIDIDEDIEKKLKEIDFFPNEVEYKMGIVILHIEDINLVPKQVDMITEALKEAIV